MSEHPSPKPASTPVPFTGGGAPVPPPAPRQPADMPLPQLQHTPTPVADRPVFVTRTGPTVALPADAPVPPVVDGNRLAPTPLRAARQAWGADVRNRRGWLYLLEDVVDGERLLQFGITTVPASRLATHAKAGFVSEPVMLLACPSRQVALDLETRLMELVRCVGVPSASARGYRFSGASETVPQVCPLSTALAGLLTAQVRQWALTEDQVVVEERDWRTLQAEPLD